MLKFEANCNGCIFGEVSNGVQKTCLLGRLDNIEDKKLEDGFYTFNKYCNAFRDKEWLDKVDGSPQEKVREETKVKLGVCINFIGCYDNEVFRQTVRSLNGAGYCVVLNDRPEHNKDLYDIVKEELNLHPSRINVVQIIEQDEKYYIDEAFNAAARNGYFCYIKAGTVMPQDFYNKINDAVNVKMLPLMICHDENHMLFQSMIFKYLCGNKSRITNDGNVDERTFLEKAAEMNTENSCIFNWGEIFNV